MRARFTTAALLAAVVPVALAACSTGSAATAPPATSAAAAITTTPTALKPDSFALSGASLKAALAPASTIGAGFTLDSTGSRDSGAGWITARKTAPANCTHLDDTGWIDITGVRGVSFAQNDYIDKATSDETAQEIDAYQGTTAATVLAALGRTATTCPTYHDAQTSNTVHVTEQATAGLGDGAYTITLSDPVWQTPTTLIAARVGTAVITTISTRSKASATAVTRRIVTDLRADA